MTLTTFGTIHSATSAISASPAPILFPDTCALLDLIRIPVRAKSVQTASREIQAAQYLFNLSHRSPNGLWIVIPPLVRNEWNEKIQETLIELQSHLKNLDETAEIVHAVASTLGIQLQKIEWSGKNVEGVLKNLSEDFFKFGAIVCEEQFCTDRAYIRARKGEAPGRKGGQINDCIIIEHCIELCSQLRGSGFSEKCTFLTSNTHDYCIPSPLEPKEPLKSELGRVGLSLTTDWQWTKSTLGT